MLTDFLQDRALRYVSGELSAEERESFEVLLEFQLELRAQVTELQEAVAVVVQSGVPVVAPPAALKARLLGAMEGLTQSRAEGLVATGPDGLVLWVNATFTAMCGYSLAELKGRKPGQLLQGPDTDPAAIGRIRESLRARRACRETLVNYHKDGTTYRADIRIDAIIDDEGKPLWFVAKERKLPADETVLTA